MILESPMILESHGSCTCIIPLFCIVTVPVAVVRVERGYPSELRLQQTFSYDRHRHATFPTSSLDRVVFLPRSFISIPRIEPIPLKARRITTPMLYHWATACSGAVLRFIVLFPDLGKECCRGRCVLLPIGG